MADFVQYINNTGATPLVQLNAALALVYGADVAAEVIVSTTAAELLRPKPLLTSHLASKNSTSSRSTRLSLNSV